MCCGTEAGSYLRLIDSCITQFKAQGPARTCNESKEEDEEEEENVEYPASTLWMLAEASNFDLERIMKVPLLCVY